MIFVDNSDFDVIGEKTPFMGSDSKNRYPGNPRAEYEKTINPLAR
jgi:hypothetical protein